MTTTRPRSHVTWIVPPKCQGQAIEMAYGTDDDGGCWQRRIDRSDPDREAGTTYRYLYHVTDKGASWDPANREPRS